MPRCQSSLRILIRFVSSTAKTSRLCWTLALFAAGSMIAAGAEPPAPRWWKGNLQTQSYWSDGDAMPEDVVGWYKDHGFHFVALSDHDRPPVGELWKEIGTVEVRNNVWQKVHPQIFEQYRQRYGDDWVQTRAKDGRTEVRLKPVDEFGPLFNEPQRFLVMPSHQIFTRVEDKQGRIRLINPGVACLDIVNSVAPLTSARSRDPAAALQQTVDLVHESAATSGRDLLLGLAHPNYLWQLTAEDLVRIDQLRFIEIYTALPSCNSNGNEQRCSVERMWDIVLTRRLAEFSKPVIYGLASDDAHTFEQIPGLRAYGRPGRGWIMVRARYLTPESLFQSMQQGDFYASSGVVLDDVRRTANSLSVSIQGEPGVRYTTRYIGTRKGYDPSSQPVLDERGHPLRTTRHYSESIGEVLHRSSELTSHYKFQGNEIYVRARITSDRPHPDPSWRGQTECAWTQP